MFRELASARGILQNNFHGRAITEPTTSESQLLVPSGHSAVGGQSQKPGVTFPSPLNVCGVSVPQLGSWQWSRHSGKHYQTVFSCYSSPGPPPGQLWPVNQVERDGKDVGLKHRS